MRWNFHNLCHLTPQLGLSLPTSLPPQKTQPPSTCVCLCVRCLRRQVLDYTQYYLDLAAANALGEAVWQPEYNLTTQYFGSGEVNAIALHNLADRFSTGEGPLFAK